MPFLMELKQDLTDSRVDLTPVWDEFFSSTCVCHSSAPSSSLALLSVANGLMNSTSGPSLLPPLPLMRVNSPVAVKQRHTTDSVKETKHGPSLLGRLGNATPIAIFNPNRHLFSNFCQVVYFATFKLIELFPVKAELYFEKVATWPLVLCKKRFCCILWFNNIVHLLFLVRWDKEK